MNKKKYLKILILGITIVMFAFLSLIIHDKNKVLSDDGDIGKNNPSYSDGYNRINNYTERYYTLLEECSVTEISQGINIHITFVPEVGAFPVKQDIYQQVAYHALHIWDFYPEVNLFKYDILWDDKQKQKVMTITIDKNAIDNLEANYIGEMMNQKQSMEYAFENCFTSVVETDETKSWRNIGITDTNSPVP